MKNLFLTIIIILVHFSISAQEWNDEVSGQLTTNDKVGIGTDSPESQLDIYKNLSFGKDLINIPSHLTSYNQNTYPSISSMISGSTGGTLMESAGHGHFVIGIRDNGVDDGFHIISTSQSYSGQSNGTAAPYNKIVTSFLANGNVGIGTNSPKTQLDIYKNLSFGKDLINIPSHLTSYNQNTYPSISSMISGSTGGTLMESAGHGHFVIGIRDNGVDDGFHIISTSQSYSGQSNGTAAPYNKIVTSFLANGNVGIGTNSPKTQLDIYKNLSFGKDLINIPSHLTSYNQNTYPSISSMISGSTGGTLMESAGHGHFVIGIRDNGVDDGFHIISTSQSYSGQSNGTAAPYNKIVTSFLANGNVGIGTNSPDSKLTVAGNIHSQEVKVTATAGADFVFEESYDLRSLEETEAYIKTNKHLPEIKPADEMVKEGIVLGEMNIKLLQKIEELTLYLIEQNKENKNQQQQLENQQELIKNQSGLIKKLENRINQLENQ